MPTDFNLNNQSKTEADAAWDSAEYNARRAEQAECEIKELRKQLNTLRRIVGIYADPLDASDVDRAIIRQCARLSGALTKLGEYDND